MIYIAAWLALRRAMTKHLLAASHAYPTFLSYI